MKILIACEESQTVCKAFRALGHEAYSCDIIPSSGGHPEWHIRYDVLSMLTPRDTGWGKKKGICFTTDDGTFHVIGEQWDMMIAHPPCTDLAVSGAAWFKEKIADGRQQRALDFVQKLMDAPIERICIENPVSVISTKIKKPSQTIQPYQFGHPETKRTCLWLKNIPLLKPTNVVEPEYMRRPDGEYYRDKKGKRYSRIHFMSRSNPNRAKERSKTYQGIADAMADQWGNQP